jgi:hypothetical protein
MNKIQFKDTGKKWNSLPVERLEEMVCTLQRQKEELELENLQLSSDLIRSKHLNHKNKIEISNYKKLLKDKEIKV